MAGTIHGLGLSQQFDANGNPLSGGKLYLYEANTSTPVTTYEDFALSISQTHPIELDSAGRIPSFWLADGSYRVRLTDVNGNEIFDESSITAIGPSSGTSTGSSVDANAIFQTGDLLWLPVAGTRTGWVRANARTIGSAASGASERANADCEDLFTYLWTNFSDTLCPVTGGRGASAAADWSANKVIATLDMRSKSILGLEDMGNTAAGITGGSSSAAAAVGASTYTIALANLPSTTLSSTGLIIRTTGGAEVKSGTIIQTSLASNEFPLTGIYAFSSAAAPTTVSISGTIPLGGSGTDLDILTPARVGTYYIRL